MISTNCYIRLTLLLLDHFDVNNCTGIDEEHLVMCVIDWDFWSDIGSAVLSHLVIVWCLAIAAESSDDSNRQLKSSDCLPTCRLCWPNHPMTGLSVEPIGYRQVKRNCLSFIALMALSLSTDRQQTIYYFGTEIVLPSGSQLLHGFTSHKSITLIVWCR